jgi:serine/threonine-protein phosphatase 2A regulatory subunit A
MVIVSKVGLGLAYMRLLRDNEAELRITAAEKVTKFYCILSPELATQYILPCVKVHIHSKL